MFEERRVTWRRRISRAVMQLVINVIFWMIIPLYVFGLISGSLPSSSLPITSTFIFAFGATITGLQVLSALTEGMVTSVTFLTGSHIASAYYIYTAVSGGTLALSAAGMGLSLAFQPLLYLMVLPSLFSAIRAPLTYFAEEHETASPTPNFA